MQLRLILKLILLLHFLIAAIPVVYRHAQLI